MRRGVRAFAGRDPTTARLIGCCFGVKASRRYLDVRGVLFLARPFLTAPGYVVHELAHATFRATEAAGERVRHGPFVGGRTLAARHATAEERYCLRLERLTDAFWSEAERAGLLD